MQSSKTLAILLFVSAIAYSSACDDSGDCDACKTLPLVKQAAANMGRIQAMLQTKECESWRDLQFRTVSFTFKGDAKCRTFGGKPYPKGEFGQCAKAEAFDLSLDEEIAVEAKTQAIDDLAREGQLECEPNGTMVFNRGNVRFSKLDSLYEPYAFFPLGFGEGSDLTVGFEVFLKSDLTAMGDPVPSFWCHKIDSAFVMIYDVVDAEGKSVLPRYV
ncbi:hypothetical protein BSKO_08523 [Bryopsis sp. KO-2023]|nr:hypothetical protein BSKO_08523 [Bryopsis sp. KO-2023]